jgi:hypothetical protein
MASMQVAQAARPVKTESVASGRRIGERIPQRGGSGKEFPSTWRYALSEHYWGGRMARGCSLRSSANRFSICSCPS